MNMSATIGNRTQARPEATSATAGRPCLFPDQLPAHLRDSYETLALIATPDHLAELDPADARTLIVCCDWVMWQDLIAAGRHAVHYELGILDWQRIDALNTDLFLHADDWILAAGANDPSLFRGVSIGRLFGAEMSMVLMNHHRLERALRALIDRFRPRRIDYYAFRYDVNYLSLALRGRLVREVAADLDVEVVDHTAADDAPENNAKAVAAYRQKGHGRLKNAAILTFSYALEGISRLRNILRPGRRRTLMLVNANVALPLVQGYRASAITPVFLSRTLPRRLALYLHCLRHGVELVNPWPKSVSGADRALIDAVRDALLGLTSAPATGALAFANAYVRENIVNDRTLREAAGDILAAEALLERLRPSRIVVDGVRSRRHLIFLQLAKARGIACDYTWHAPLTPQSLKLGAVGSDPRQPVLVDRVLSWGRTNEAWLQRIAARVPFERTGSPLRDKYSGGAGAGIGPRTGTDRHVLVLQYGFNIVDLAGVNANMYGTFVNLIRQLRGLGYTDIRYKMHPGPGRWQREYFERIAAHFGIECEIQQMQPFEDCLDWADVVIGPSHTGAMFETLAAGKPYISLMLPPHSTFDLAYFGDFPVLQSLDDLPAALDDYDTAAARRLLNDVYAVDDVPNPTRKFWEVLAQDPPGKQGDAH